MNKLLKLLNRKPRENLVEKLPEDVYRNVSEEFPEYTKEDIAKIGGVESQHGLFDEQLAGGTPRGLFQFMPRTAEAIKPGSRSIVSDINTQEDLMKEYLGRNTSRIKKIKQPEIEDAYLYHNLGPGKGKKFLNATEDTPITDVLTPDIIKANPTLYNYKTVGEAKAAIKKLLNEKGGQFKFSPDITDLFTGDK